jgi:hypothetical protein
MYTSVRKYRCRPEDVAELAHRVDEVFAPKVESMPGFAAYEIVDCGDGTVYSLTFCSDREAADRSIGMAAEFVQEELGDMEIERVEAANGEVLVSRAAAPMLEPAHA